MKDTTMIRKEYEEDTIDLMELFIAIKRKILLILATGLLGAALYGVYTVYFIDPVYTATSSVLVLSKETTLTSIADLQLGSQLAKDYQVLIKSTDVMNDVIENVGLKKMTAEGLRNCITINNPTDTRILEISVNYPDPVTAKEIADEVAYVSSEYVGDKMEVIPPKIIEKGKVPSVQTAPSVKKNLFLGFIAGAVLCGGIITVIAMMDDTIKSEEDLEKYLGIPSLAVVPDRRDFITRKKKKAARRGEK